MNSLTKGKSLFYLLTALVVAAFLALGSAMTAMAAPVIEAGKTGSLNITKLRMPDGGPIGATSGVEIDLPAGTTPIAGVEFSVQQINNIDLRTNKGWESLSALELNEKTGALTGNGDDGNAVTLGDNKASGATDEQGQLKVDNLPVGAYLVQESKTPVGVTKAAPFIVTVPITNPEGGNSWLYDVFVYPKNSQVDQNSDNPQDPLDPNDPNDPFDPDLQNPDDPNLPDPSLPKLLKQIDDQQPYTGKDTQQVTYTIWAPIPRVPSKDAADPFLAPDGFKIEDELPAGVTAKEVTAALVYKNAGAEQSSVNALSDADYDKVVDQTVSVTMKEAGLAKFKAAAVDKDARIKVTITVDVDPEIANDGQTGETTQLRNFAKVYPDQAAIDAGNRWLATTLVDSRWGSFSFWKKNQDDEGLGKAEFNLALTKAQAEKTEFIRTESTASSNASETVGQVTFTGLRASDFANAKPQKAGVQQDGAWVNNDKYIVYWLSETKAPKGYVPLAAPIPVVLLKDGTIKQVEVDDNGAVVLDGNGNAKLSDFDTVINVKTNGGFTLPLTGGNGTWLLTLGGIALLAFVLFAARRRKDDAETA